MVDQKHHVSILLVSSDHCSQFFATQANADLAHIDTIKVHFDSFSLAECLFGVYDYLGQICNKYVIVSIVLKIKLVGVIAHLEECYRVAVRLVAHPRVKTAFRKRALQQNLVKL